MGVAGMTRVFQGGGNLVGRAGGRLDCHFPSVAKHRRLSPAHISSADRAPSVPFANGRVLKRSGSDRVPLVIAIQSVTPRLGSRTQSQDAVRGRI